MKKRELSWLVYFLFAVGLFSFVIIPFCGDVEVFLGSSRLADYYGRSLVYNSFNVWEIKGVFLRLFFYALYSVVRLLAPCPSMEFSIILSLLYAVLVIALSWFIACNAITDRDDRPLFAASFCTAFFAIDSWCKMQAEMTCTLLLFVALSLALKRGGRELLRLLMSGVLIGFLFWFKAPLLLLSVCFAAGFLMLSESPFRIGLKKIFVVAVGSLVSLLLVGILVYYINPNEYSRMLMASIYQNTLLSGNGFTGMYVVKRFITGFAKAMLSIPALFIGAACLIVNFVHNIQEKERLSFYPVGSSDTVCHAVELLFYISLFNLYVCCDTGDMVFFG